MSSFVNAQGTAFTYQGRLNDGAGPATGNYDLRFALFDAASAGTQQGALLTNSATGVSNGLFTVTLDFGAQFPGANRWLEIAVRTNSGSTFFTLAPRQALTPAPYAITAGSVISGGLAAGTYGNALSLTNVANRFSGNGSNLTSLNASQLTNGTVSDARLSANVALRAGGNTFIGQQTVLGGNVGIGTGIPNKALEVRATSVADGLRVDGFGSGISPSIQVSTNGTPRGELGVAAFPAHYSNDARPGDFVVRSSTSDARLLLQNGGANSAVAIVSNTVGVGTTAPADVLHVASPNPVRMRVESTTANFAGYISKSLTSEWFTGVIPSSGPGTWEIYENSPLSGSRMLINSNGYVGIGTLTPASSLHVNGGILARGGPPGSFGLNNNGYSFSVNGGDNDSGMFSSANGQVEFYNNSVEAMRITNGFVGIGVTNPLAPLHVTSGLFPTLLVDGSSPAGTWMDIRNTAGGTNWLILSTGSANGEGPGKLMFLTAAGPAQARSQMLTIEPTGRVGIGTTAPAVSLDVVGNINSSGKSVTVGEGNLRIVRGIFSSTGVPAVNTGSGWTVARTPGGSATGDYTVTFNQVFTDAPAVTCSSLTGSATYCTLYNLTSSSVRIVQVLNGVNTDGTFVNFIAIGNR